MDFNKFPIVIMGIAPRCGSTPYTHLVQQLLDIPAFHEPWTVRLCRTNKDYNETVFKNNPSIYAESYINYINYREKTNKYIVKFWITDLEYRSPYNNDVKTGYKILLLRKDIVGQIASRYIAECRKKWVSLKQEIEPDYLVNIDRCNISIFIQMTTRFSALTEASTFFNKTIYYEEVDFSKLKNYSFKKTKQPLNLGELRSVIEEQLKDKIPLHWKTDQMILNHDTLTTFLV